MHITVLLMPEVWTLDTIAKVKALIKLQERIPRALARSERGIARDEKAIRKAAVARRLKRMSGS